MEVREPRKIFIVGCARTGTSLLRQVLNESERICIAPETHFLHRLSSVGRRAEKWNKTGSLWDDRAIAEFVDYAYRDRKISSFWQWLKRNVERKAFERWLMDSDRSERGVFSCLMQIYAQKTLGEKGTDLILGEKTPAHLYYVPTLLEWFPEAKTIHTFRDPRAITASRIKKVRKKQIGLGSALPLLPKWLTYALDTPIELARMSKAWFDAVHLHTRYEQEYPDRYRLLRFEDLIREPEKELRSICDMLGIPFDGKMVDEIVVVGSGYSTQRRGSAGFDQGAVDRWQQHLNPLAKTWFLILARKKLERFGYLP